MSLNHAHRLFCDQEFKAPRNQQFLALRDGPNDYVIVTIFCVHVRFIRAVFTHECDVVVVKVFDHILLTDNFARFSENQIQEELPNHWSCKLKHQHVILWPGQYVSCPKDDISTWREEAHILQRKGWRTRRCSPIAPKHTWKNKNLAYPVSYMCISYFVCGWRGCKLVTRESASLTSYMSFAIWKIDQLRLQPISDPNKKRGGRVEVVWGRMLMFHGACKPKIARKHQHTYQGWGRQGGVGRRGMFTILGICKARIAHKH